MLRVLFVFPHDIIVPQKQLLVDLHCDEETEEFSLVTYYDEAAPNTELIYNETTSVMKISIVSNTIGCRSTLSISVSCYIIHCKCIINKFRICNLNLNARI